MFQPISRARIIGLWFGAVALIGATVTMVDGGLPLDHLPLLLTLCLMPPTILLIVWRSAPPVTVAEVLYAVSAVSAVRNEKGGRV